MSASDGCGMCTVLVLGCMNEGVDVNGNVEVYVGWEDVAMIG